MTMTTQAEWTAVDEINLADPDFWLRPDYHDALARLRAERPVSWHQHPESGKGFWALLDHRDINEATRNWPSFTSRYGVAGGRDYDPQVKRAAAGSLLELDPPEHTAPRRRIGGVFAPRNVRKMEEYIREQARDIVGGYRRGDVVEFVDTMSAPLPLYVICDVMGVPREDRALMRQLTDLLSGDRDPDVGGTPEQGAAATAELRAYGSALAMERRLRPQDDLLSELATQEIQGKPLSEDQLGGYFTLLIVAGNETTRTAISHGMHAFSLFPDQRDKFLSDPVGLAGSMADEVVRWATPFRHHARVVTEDLVFRGQRMRKGQKVVLCYASANRDPALFEDPFRFDITRDATGHQSFGTGGPHFCVGANLARREIAVFFQEFFARYPEANVIGEPALLRSIQLNGIKSLTVQL